MNTRVLQMNKYAYEWVLQWVLQWVFISMGIWVLQRGGIFPKVCILWAAIKFSKNRLRRIIFDSDLIYIYLYIFIYIYTG